MTENQESNHNECLFIIASIIRLFFYTTSICLFVALMSGCSSKPTKNTVIDTSDVVIERNPPSQAMIECERLKPLNDKTFSSAILKIQEIALLYNDCESKRHALEDFINKK